MEVAELLARGIEWRSYENSKRARQSKGEGAAARCSAFALAWVRESEVRERNEGSIGVVRLISPSWPDRPGRCWCTAAMRRA